MIGILCWEEGCSPRGLAQLEKLPGNSTNPVTFAFPVKYSRIKGANIHTILENPCQKVLCSMIGEARKMEAQGIRAITTSCGFNAVFQRELADSVSVPIFTSSLMQIPLAQNMLGKQQTVGVITAKKSALTEKHLQSVGVKNHISIHIEGLEACTEWNKIFSSPNEEIDIPTVENDVVHIARSMMKMVDIGAFVLECTDLPPFADAIRKATGRPVFDFVTLTNFIYQAIKSVV
ncbi:aspartate/glutamate racemase family protein [uncultured Desulfosarcina sp.]|uniref:aspartate/glutamate racemase family protein n=1 Tax=uncultured Desulfosarcina sp. TaxID=218289 RepID=UPI0029C9AAF5|nr:aspartate/glutamate racemase family protein [uncultured Desulfosarcina sp.]